MKRLKIELKQYGTGTWNVPTLLTTALDADVLFVSALGWNSFDAASTRTRFVAFEDDWNTPGMEAYDKL